MQVQDVAGVMLAIRVEGCEVPGVSLECVAYPGFQRSTLAKVDRMVNNLGARLARQIPCLVA